MALKGVRFILSTCNKGMVNPHARKTLIEYDEIKIKINMTQGKEGRAKIT
jgi:hypothetical protein